ncbi:MAG: hypothetical protein AB1630_10110 [bacterium]
MKTQMVERKISKELVEMAINNPNEIVKKKPYWTTKEVISLVKERFKVEIKESRIREIFKEGVALPVYNLSQPDSL